MSDDGESTIVIKKIKKGGHGHHGGAWKVAYADFVTAMMAFFLLMWLLNATEAEELAGLADYFAPTVGIKDQMGIGFRGGKGPISKGIGADKNTNKGIIYGAPPAGTVVGEPETDVEEVESPQEERIQITTSEGTTKGSEEDEEESEAADAASQSIDDLANQLTETIQETLGGEELQGNINMQRSPDGLKIDIAHDGTMFEPGKWQLTQSAEGILREVAGIISLLPNYVAIEGHTDALVHSGDKNYTNWELSTERANAVRRFLVGAGVPKEQIAKVIGKADHESINPKDPESPQNNRVTVILLKDGIKTHHNRPSPDAVFIRTKRPEPVFRKTEEVPEVEQPADGKDDGDSKKASGDKDKKQKEGAEEGKTEEEEATEGGDEASAEEAQEEAVQDDSPLLSSDDLLQPLPKQEEDDGGDTPPSEGDSPVPLGF